MTKCERCLELLVAAFNIRGNQEWYDNASAHLAEHRTEEQALKAAEEICLTAKEPFCDGPVCANCCLCGKCGRKVGTRHLNVCACPDGSQHWFCPDCQRRRVHIHAYR